MEEEMESKDIFKSEDEFENFIRSIIKKENEKLYRRIAGHFHKQEDSLHDMEGEIDDLKKHMEYIIKSS
jgi:uncharacterized membrane protein YgaE (UPF0421/DUF939 family)